MTNQREVSHTHMDVRDRNEGLVDLKLEVKKQENERQHEGEKTVKRKNKQRQTAEYLFPQRGRMSTLEKRQSCPTLPCSHLRVDTRQCSLPSASISAMERTGIRGDHGAAYGNI